MAEKHKDGQSSRRQPRLDRPSPGLSILVVLITSVVLAIIFLGTLWFVFFRT